MAVVIMAVVIMAVIIVAVVIMVMRGPAVVVMAVIGCGRHRFIYP
jgi:hypothetical protein